MLGDLWPEPAQIPLGADTYCVSALTLRDLAALERFAGCEPAAYWLDLAGAESLADSPARHARLRVLYDRALASLPGFGSPELMTALATPYGRCEELYLSLRHATPDVTRADVVAIYPAITDPQWTLFERLAWSLDPLDETARVIDAEIGATLPLDPGPPESWERAIARVARRTGWTFAQIGDLTLSQWDAIGRAGAKREHPYAEPAKPPKGWTWKKLDREVNAKRAAFWTPTPAPDPASAQIPSTGSDPPSPASRPGD